MALVSHLTDPKCIFMLEDDSRDIAAVLKVIQNT